MAFAGDYIILGAKGKGNMQPFIFSLLVSDLLWSCSRQRQGIQAGRFFLLWHLRVWCWRLWRTLLCGSLVHKKQHQSYGGGASSSTSSSGWEGVAANFVDSSDLFHAATTTGCHPRRDHLAAVRGRPSTSHPALQAEPAALRVTPAGQVRAAPLSVIPAGPSAVGPLLSAAEGHQRELQVQGQCAGAVLAANVLAAAYREVRSWPEVFVRVYVEDATGERLWVDHLDCKGFVDNIVTAFGTK